MITRIYSDLQAKIREYLFFNEAVYSYSLFKYLDRKYFRIIKKIKNDHE